MFEIELYTYKTFRGKIKKNHISSQYLVSKHVLNIGNDKTDNLSHVATRPIA